MSIWQIIKDIFSDRDKDSIVCIPYENPDDPNNRSYCNPSQ